MLLITLVSVLSSDVQKGPNPKVLHMAVSKLISSRSAAPTVDAAWR